jgi:hypothetical protein
MRSSLVVLGCLLAGSAIAQFHGGHAGGFGGAPHQGFGHGRLNAGVRVVGSPSTAFQSHSFGALGLPPLNPIPPLGGIGTGAVPRFGPFGTGSGMHRGSGFGGFNSLYGYPILGGYDTEYEPSSNVVIVQQPPTPPVIVQTAPREIKPAIHEYGDTAPASPAAAARVTPSVTPEPSPAAEPPTFEIARKDGSTVSATAVWVDARGVHYIDPDGAHHQIALNEIDREETRRRNRAKHLNLPLPPAGE